MSLKTLFQLLITFGLFGALTGDKPAYKLFDSTGQETGYDKLLKDALKADVVMFGENHDNPISHWLELELTKDMYADKKTNLVLGAEMFEADNQAQLNEYLNGYIKESVFKENTRLWPNYVTDYSPLVDFAKTNKIPFVATNIPRRYASMVSNKGFEFLDSIATPETRKWMAPLPIYYDSSLKCYKEMRTMMGPGHSSPNLPKAQAIKDATMAYFITKNLAKGKTFLHYNGAYHSNNYMGIVSYLLRTNPKLKIVTISSVEQKDITILDKESINLANYIIATPEDMTKTR
jgi:uncharacterized iron-regulated protein